MALDPSDNLWVPFGAGLLKISSSGVTLSPPTGYPISQSGISLPYKPFFTSDGSGNIWGVVIRSSDSLYCLQEYSGSGVLLSPPTGYCGSQSSAHISPRTAFADNLNHVYLALQGGVSNIPLEAFSSSGTYTDLQTPATSPVDGYLSAVYDPKYQRIWGFDEAAGTYNLNLDGTVNFLSGPAAVGPYLAADGAGNLWSAGGSLGGVNEVSATGLALEYCDVAAGCDLLDDPLHNYAAGNLAVDPAGDLFVVETQAGHLYKYPGLAAAK